MSSSMMKVTDDERRRILEESKITPEEFQEKVNILKEWLVQNKNFPEEAANFDNRIKVVLLNCKMNVEKSKRCFEGYFSIRTIYSEDFDKIIIDDHFQRFKKLAIHISMPNLLPDLCRLYISQCTDVEAVAEDGLDYYYMAFMIAEIRFEKDFFLSNEILVDLKHFTWKNVMKFPPSIHYKLVHTMNAINLRIHRIHIVNAPVVWDKVSMMMKSILPMKIVEKICFYNSYEDLHKAVPKEYLPSDYGGTEKSLKELQEMWYKEFDANKDIIRAANEYKLRGFLKQKDTSTDDYLGMGAEGSFKKLSID